MVEETIRRLKRCPQPNIYFTRIVVEQSLRGTLQEAMKLIDEETEQSKHSWTLNDHPAHGEHPTGT